MGFCRNQAGICQNSVAFRFVNFSSKNSVFFLLIIIYSFYLYILFIVLISVHLSPIQSQHYDSLHVLDFSQPLVPSDCLFSDRLLTFSRSTKNFKLFSCSCNKNANSCINLMNGWKESCSVKENKAKISQSHNQFIYEILWCITLYHTRCVFFSGHGYFQKTLKIRVATKRKRPTGVLSTGEAFSFLFI